MTTYTRTARQIEHAEYLQSYRWRTISGWRRRWDVTCRVCRSSERLQAHHSSYRFKGRLGWLFGLGWLLEFLDCITLCDVHHKSAHNCMNIKEFSD